MDEKAPPPMYTDALIGLRLKAALELTNTTQAELAAYMRDAGFEWTDRTVREACRGRRTLRLREALEVSTFLDVPLSELYEEPLTPEMKDVVQTARAVLEARQAMLQEAMKHERQRLHLLELLVELPEDQWQNPRLRLVWSAVEITPEHAIANDVPEFVPTPQSFGELLAGLKAASTAHEQN